MTRWRRLRRFSKKKTVAWILHEPLKTSSIACAVFSPGPAPSRPSVARTCNCIARGPCRYPPSSRRAKIAVDGTRLLVGCAEHTQTALELLEVQLEGKRRMSASEFINGYRPKPGDHLGQ
jgi:hypothetical protein